MTTPGLPKILRGLCAAGNRCIAQTKADQINTLQCVGCKRIWHLRCREDGELLWERKRSGSLKYWSCAKGRCRAEADRLEAVALAEPEIIGSATDSDSDEIQILKVSGPSRSVTTELRNGPSLAHRNQHAGPCGVSDDDSYGRSAGPHTAPVPQPAGLRRIQSLRSEPQTTAIFQPYSRPLHLAHSTASVQMHERKHKSTFLDPGTRSAPPDAGPSTPQTRQPKAAKKTPRDDHDRPGERSPPARKRMRTQSPSSAQEAGDILGFLGKDALAHVLGSDSDNAVVLSSSHKSIEVSRSGGRKPYGSEEDVYTVSQANDFPPGSRLEPFKPSLAAPRVPQPQPLSHIPPLGTHHSRYGRLRCSPPPPPPRPSSIRSNRAREAMQWLCPPHTSPPPMPTSPPPPPVSRARSPTPLDSSVKEAMIRASQDELRAQGRFRMHKPPSVQEVVAPSVSDVDLGMHNGLNSRMQGSPSSDRDSDTSSDGELGAWARRPYHPAHGRARSPGGAIGLENFYQDNTGPRHGAVRLAQ